MDSEKLLKEYFARREICIINVLPFETLRVNGNTSLTLFDPREPPVFDPHSMRSYTLDLHLWDKHHRHLVDPIPLSVDERVRHLTSLVAVGITESTVPNSSLPFFFYVENGYRLWRNAAIKFRAQYATPGR